MKLYTCYDRPPIEDSFEYCEESMTETAGYVPTERLIQTFEEAGIRLEITRDFDFPGVDGVPDDYEPVNFSSRLDALALDSAVKQRLMEHLEATKKAHGVVDVPGVSDVEGVKADGPA